MIFMRLRHGIFIVIYSLFAQAIVTAAHILRSHRFTSASLHAHAVAQGLLRLSPDFSGPSGL